MTVIKTYIAEDGKRFDNEWDCEEYENTLRQNQFKDLALLFDGDGNRLPLSEKGFESCYFLVCKTDEAAEYVYEKFNGWAVPWTWREERKAGMWTYTDDGWKTIEEFLAAAEIAKRILEECK